MKTKTFCSIFLIGNIPVHRRLVSKKIGKSDVGIRPDLCAFVHLDGQWFGHMVFGWRRNQSISMLCISYLSIRVRSSFSNILYTIKELTRAKSNRSKNKREIKSKLRSSIKLVCWLQLIHQVNSTHFFVV